MSKDSTVGVVFDVLLMIDDQRVERLETGTGWIVLHHDVDHDHAVDDLSLEAFECFGSSLLSLGIATGAMVFERSHDRPTDAAGWIAAQARLTSHFAFLLALLGRRST